MNNLMSNLEIAERAKAMSLEEQIIVASALDTKVMLDELIRRFNYATTTLESIQKTLKDAEENV